MREDVEQPAARGLAERLEVAPPDLLGAVGPIPHAVVLHVDRLVTEEMDRADHIVEVARLQQAGHAVLTAGHEVRLDPQTKVGLRAHVLAVGVEILARVRLPERVPPHVERLFEAVDVLGDSQLGDSALARRGPVALGVCRREVQLGGRAELVGPEVDVVIGEHMIENRGPGSAAHGRLRRPHGRFNQAARPAASPRPRGRVAW